MGSGSILMTQSSMPAKAVRRLSNETSLKLNKEATSIPSTCLEGPVILSEEAHCRARMSHFCAAPYNGRPFFPRSAGPPPSLPPTVLLLHAGRISGCEGAANGHRWESHAGVQVVDSTAQPAKVPPMAARSNRAATYYLMEVRTAGPMDS